MTDTMTTDNGRTADGASPRIELLSVLGHLLDLQVRGVEAHAHFHGTRCHRMQRQLESLVQTVREAVLAVEGALGVADGAIGRHPRTGSARLQPAERCTTAAANMMSNRISAVSSEIRCILWRMTATGDPSVHVLRAVTGALEAQAQLLAIESDTVASATSSVMVPSAADLIAPPTRRPN
jgi:starvation-inducible DNA-binding protein